VSASVDPIDGAIHQLWDRQQSHCYLTVFQHVREARSVQRDPKWTNHWIYHVCFLNADAEDARLKSFWVLFLGRCSGSGFLPVLASKDKPHLTPLEQTLQTHWRANTVLGEMKYMEMRAPYGSEDGGIINQRVRWFSYLSISCAAVVTYVQ
jgi:hypothetical protein